MVDFNNVALKANKNLCKIHLINLFLAISFESMNTGISLVSPVHGGAPVYLGNRGELERPWKKAWLLPLPASMSPAEDSEQSPRSLEKVSPAPGLFTPADHRYKKA